tara:strand:- start:1401 stop:1877 length:477 start_codon:yes stop_codon:yes gene_type:complete
MQNETKNRFFLVVVDETEELHQALHFACARAKSIDANIALVYVITPNDFGHWASVNALMREEAREQAEEIIKSYSDYANSFTGKTPLVYIREGETTDQILQLIEEEEQICQLVLGANTKSDSAGPIVNYITGKGAARCKIPVVIVPGNLTDAQIEALC